eukprot:5379315-Karenia_brevis.AAC.1
MHRANAHLGVEPLLIDAKHVSLASRHRLWWIDTDWLQSDGENMQFHTHYTEVVSPHHNSSVNVWMKVMFSLQPFGESFHALRAIARQIDHRFDQQASAVHPSRR